MTKIYAPDYVHKMPVYVAGKAISEVAREFGLDPEKIIKLASNENPNGMPESARLAVVEALSDGARYPDSNGFALRKAISEKFGLPMSCVTIGNGSDKLIGTLARTFVADGDAVMFSQHSFVSYRIAAMSVNAEIIEVPSKNYGNDLDAMADAITDRTKLIFIANPNNPTGTFLPGNELDAFLSKVPHHIVVAIDEAYTEYLDPADRYDAVALLKKYPNLVISRTFSKAFGLAGLRCGFALASETLSGLLNRVRGPFNVNLLAQVAACAAINDTAFIEKAAKMNAEGKQLFYNAFDDLDIDYVKSYGNFVMFKAGKTPEECQQMALDFLKRGIIVRALGGFRVPECIRVSTGLPEENLAFIEALKDIRTRA